HQQAGGDRTMDKNLGKVHDRLRASLTALLSASALLKIPSAPAAMPASAAIFAAARIVWIADRDHAARRQTKLTLGHHGLSRLESFFDHQILIHTRTGCNRLSRHAPILAHYVNKRSVLPALHRLVRNR